MIGRPDRRRSDNRGPAAGLTVSVSIEAAGWVETGGVDWRALCADAAQAAWAGLAPPARLGSASLDILLSDDAMLHDLNRRYRGIDRPTNVLSFPRLDPARFDPAWCDSSGAADRVTVRWGFTDWQNSGVEIGIGDIAIALETVVAEARAQGKDVTQHVTHLMVHGVLHLAGHDHEDADEAYRMETLEIAILAGLGIADPYADRPAVEN